MGNASTSHILRTKALAVDNALTVRWIGPDEGIYEAAELANINTPEDLQRLKRRLLAHPL